MNKKGQCGLRVGSSACTTPTVMKATKPRPPLAARTVRILQARLKGQSRFHLHIRNRKQVDVARAAQHLTNRVVVSFFFLFVCFVLFLSGSCSSPHSGAEGVNQPLWVEESELHRFNQ